MTDCKDYVCNSGIMCATLAEVTCCYEMISIARYHRLFLLYHQAVTLGRAKQDDKEVDARVDFSSNTYNSSNCIYYVIFTFSNVRL